MNRTEFKAKVTADHAKLIAHHNTPEATVDAIIDSCMTADEPEAAAAWSFLAGAVLPKDTGSKA